MNVALVIGYDSGKEGQALREALEYFGARVVTYYIGRPKDFIDVLSGKSLYEDMEYIVLCFHGDEGEFIMGELGEDVYEEDEPKGNFGAAEVKRYARLQHKSVINSGCTLGDKALAEAFLNSGANVYIGSIDYVDGNAALMFLVRLFYGMINHEQTIHTAFEEAKLLDDETRTFQLYT
ncbi:hypothetical protein [Bacillus sp. 123MFChir2]|uniref:hypothetical protein n=1 Tax=Bacillus sp. 123MFChir2 TaxID=1169144 RepID=UPI0003784A5C|nr:hypothetical protein [Bacillus sp. 123MFChir2]